MIKKPDIEDIKSKFSIDKIVNTINSIASSNDAFSDMDPNDALGEKMKKISEQIADMHKIQSQHAKDLQQVDQLLQSMFKDVESIRAQSKVAAKSSEKVQSEKKKSEPEPEPTATTEDE